MYNFLCRLTNTTRNKRDDLHSRDGRREKRSQPFGLFWRRAAIFIGAERYTELSCNRGPPTVGGPGLLQAPLASSMPPHALSPPARFQPFPLAESATPRSFCRRRHKGHAGGLKGGQPARVSRSILTVAYPIRSTLDLFLCMANMQLWILRRDSPTKSSLPLPPEISRVRPRRPWAIIAT